jgi:peptide/nickel transport system substrate-binding protein
MVEEVVCLDDLTAVVKLSDPYAPFIPFLAWYGTQIMPAHLYEGTDWHDNPANQKPVGTGPFKFVEWIKGDHVTLAKNEDYWGEGPYVDRLVFKIIPDPNTALQSFLNGEADINVNRPGFSSLSILKRNPEVEVVVMSSPSRYYVGFNLTEEARPVTNIKVREAVAYAINKQTIVDRVLGGFGGIGEYFYTPAIPWAVDFDVKAQLYDPAKAEELLDEAGFPKDKDGWRFSVDLLYFQGADWTDMAAVIKENLEKVGIKVNLGEYEIATWIEKVLNAHNYDIALLNGFQGPDPENLTLRVSTGGGLNIMGYSNEVVDSNLKEAAKTADIGLRKPYYYAVQAQLAADVPFVPLAEVSYIYIYKKYVEGMFIDNPGKVGNGDYSLIKLNF